MKTPEYFVQRWETLSTLLFASNSTKAEVKTALAKFIEEEIQRDAREGTIERKLAQETLEEAMETMVPVEAVRPLLDIAVLAVRGSSINQNEVAKLLTELRAKHPNLFPK